MIGFGRRRPVVVLLVLLSIALALLAHYAIVAAHTPTLGAVLSLLPFAIYALVAARRPGRRLIVLWTVAIAAAALWMGWEILERNFTNLFFLEHAGMNLLLAVTFGRTLVGGSEALCTRFARIIHGALPPEVVRYTRQVTAAWTIYFSAVFLLSSALYLGGLLAAWSFLVNIASPVLVTLMFVIEYAIRLRVLPDHERIGIFGGIRAFSQHVAAHRSPAR